MCTAVIKYGLLNIQLILQASVSSFMVYLPFCCIRLSSQKIRERADSEVAPPAAIMMVLGLTKGSGGAVEGESTRLVYEGEKGVFCTHLGKKETGFHVCCPFLCRPITFLSPLLVVLCRLTGPCLKSTSRGSCGPYPGIPECLPSSCHADCTSWCGCRAAGVPVGN